MSPDKKQLLSKIAQINFRLSEIDKERQQLSDELESLNIILKKSNEFNDNTPSSVPINNKSTPQQKISLFRSLFRGRDDVFPKMWVSKKTGKKGYSPVCENE